MSTRYAAFYCEENIWHLCDEPRFEGLDARVMFISNPLRACMLWAQRAAASSGAPVIWDYHVILLIHDRSGWEVWDLDTTLGLPVRLSRYLENTFPPSLRQIATQKGFAPRLRVIDAATYREEFSSDRSHMREVDGRWKEPPPPWPAVIREGFPSFMGWTMMHEDDPEVLPLEQIQQLFASKG